jgi:hypothetical protein
MGESKAISVLGKQSLRVLLAGLLAAGCAAAIRAAPPPSTSTTPRPSSTSPLPFYGQVRTLGAGTEWRFQPLVVDLNRDGHLDLVATARLVKPSLYIWFGDGNGLFTPGAPTWSDVGYAALATGDINRDGFPDIVAASHFGGVQTLLSDGQGGFTEKVMRQNDGYVAAQLLDVDGDGQLDLVLLGYRTAGIEIYLGDGTGNWKLYATLPETRPGPTMPGRALAVADLDHDGYLDVVAAFQRWGVYVYYGDGRGRFTGGPVDFYSASREFQSLAVGDVNGDGHLDIVLNGTLAGRDQPNGPDVYLGNGRRTWKAASDGLKVLKFASAGLALGDLDGDGNLDIVAAGKISADVRDGHGLFWFRGDGNGGWQLVRESGLPTKGLPVVHGIALAKLERDGVMQIIALGGDRNGSITVWKPQR